MTTRYGSVVANVPRNPAALRLPSNVVSLTASGRKSLNRKIMISSYTAGAHNAVRVLVTLLLVAVLAGCASTASPPSVPPPREARLAALGFERTEDGYVLNLPAAAVRYRERCAQRQCQNQACAVGKGPACAEHYPSATVWSHRQCWQR